MKKVLVPVVALLISVFAVGCGGKKVVESVPMVPNAPEWVNKGSGAFADTDGKKVFYGVGMVSGVNNRALAIQSADQRARAEIAKSLDNYVAVLNKDYMASTTAGSMDKSSEEQDISVTLKGFTKFTLQGAVIVDHYMDPTSNTLYSLAKLDMAAVQQTLSEAKELDAKVRDFVRANAAVSFDELAAEEGKH